jgi:hypothetical protein
MGKHGFGDLSPMRNAGLSEVIGSWKIMVIRLPRNLRMAV